MTHDDSGAICALRAPLISLLLRSAVMGTLNLCAMLLIFVTLALTRTRTHCCVWGCFRWDALTCLHLHFFVLLLALGVVVFHRDVFDAYPLPCCINNILFAPELITDWIIIYIYRVCPADTWAWTHYACIYRRCCFCCISFSPSQNAFSAHANDVIIFSILSSPQRLNFEVLSPS